MPIMDMTQWNEFTRNVIANAGDQATLTGILSQATVDYEELFASHAEKDKTEQKLTEENEGLRKANLDLFLRFSSQKEQTGTEGGGEPQKSRAETITFEDLFKPKEE